MQSRHFQIPELKNNNMIAQNKIKTLEKELNVFYVKNNDLTKNINVSEKLNNDLKIELNRQNEELSKLYNDGKSSKKKQKQELLQEVDNSF